MGHEFFARAMTSLAKGTNCKLYIRPESIVINPQHTENLNKFGVVVKNVLFDGANTKLLAVIENTSREIMAALPQDKRFDHIKPGDKLDVGVYNDSCTCF